MNQKIYNDNAKLPTPPSPFSTEAPPNATDSTMVSRYFFNLSFTPGLVALITPAGRMVEGSVKSASDYSYSAPSYAGSHYRIIGDAGGWSNRN